MTITNVSLTPEEMREWRELTTGGAGKKKLKLPENIFPMPYRRGDEDRYPGRYVPKPKPKPDLIGVVMGKGAPYMPPRKVVAAEPAEESSEEKPWPPLKVYHHILFLLNED